MELERLLSFEGLKVGDVVTRVTLAGHQRFIYLGYDPHIKNEVCKNLYGYFLESFGRVKVERWYSEHLDYYNIYVGYDEKFIKQIETALLETRLEQLKNE